MNLSAPQFGLSVLATAYFPPVEYFFAVSHSARVLIEQHEHYQKQSWRNRCRILSASGPEDLSVPVQKEERHARPIRDIRIDYGEPWLQHHVRAFAAAYNASAFYDYYAGDLLPILLRKPVFLFDLNMALLEKLMDLLGLDIPVSLTESFEAPRTLEVLASCERDVFIFDGRRRIQPKYKGESLLAEYDCEQAYYQVFVNRDPASLRGSRPDLSSHSQLDRESFIPNLSILDLLCAEGPDAGRILRI